VNKDEYNSSSTYRRRRSHMFFETNFRCTFHISVTLRWRFRQQRDE